MASGSSCDHKGCTDTNARFLGEKPQHVYSVRFAASELWGDQAAPRNTVRVDMWDDYVEP